MSEELKPCPFCGGGVSIDASCNHSFMWEGGCESDGCYVQPQVWLPTRAAAIAAWNRRTPDAQPEPAAPTVMEPVAHTEQWWLHRLDMEKTQAWQQGYAQGLNRAAHPPRAATVVEHDMHHDALVTMQAALIEWKHGKGAEAALQWLVNTLRGPGLLPGADEPWGKDAQRYFDANQSSPLPVCTCGTPSHIGWMGQGFCSDAHYQEAKAAQ